MGVTHNTVRQWCRAFGPRSARNLRHSAHAPLRSRQVDGTSAVSEHYTNGARDGTSTYHGACGNPRWSSRQTVSPTWVCRYLPAGTAASSSSSTGPPGFEPKVVCPITASRLVPLRNGTAVERGAGPIEHGVGCFGETHGTQDAGGRQQKDATPAGGAPPGRSAQRPSDTDERQYEEPIRQRGFVDEVRRIRVIPAREPDSESRQHDERRQVCAWIDCCTEDGEEPRQQPYQTDRCWRKEHQGGHRGPQEPAADRRPRVDRGPTRPPIRLADPVTP